MEGHGSYYKGIVMTNSKKAIRLHITGLVQGVGFRPFVYRLALKNQLWGWVANSMDGVHIKAVGRKADLDEFLREIQCSAPPAAEVSNILVLPVRPNGEKKFVIAPSSSEKEGVTEVSPDIAVCRDCLRDMEVQAHRKWYPLINCTNCGPRFSIIKSLPYDRKLTTMAGFAMCETCSEEYSNILDRRFHAQPVACNSCGPQYKLYSKTGHEINGKDIPAEAARLIDEGEIIAIKGTGGFHLACDAMNPFAVNRLRSGKLREGKPFAVMFPDIQTLKQFATPDKKETKALKSWKRPIVLLNGKNKLPPEVTAGLPSIGSFLPYMPFHYLLFSHLSTKAIVLTSGNVSDEPMVTSKAMALNNLNGIFDFLIDYNREIYNRTDDSVIQCIEEGIQIIRRSRGFVPKPIRLSLDAGGILATGGELKNCFCLGKGSSALMSQHIGDLKNMETFSFFSEAVGRATRLFRFEPKLIATDLHPDYLTTRWSQEQGLPVEYVQHHHAHIASCMAENQVEESVIGISLDGTGYGTDGCMWGSEIIRCDLKGFLRLGHFEYMPMPGGDKAVEQPWRMALGCLYKVFGGRIPGQARQSFAAIDQYHQKMVIHALDNAINVTQTSGAGRLFDAVSVLLGLMHIARFEAEGPMRLEACLDKKTKDFYETEIDENGTILLTPVIRGIVDDLKTGIRAEVISARFHNSIIEALAKAVFQTLNPLSPEKVILSGGAFQNRFLLSGLSKRLSDSGILVLTNHQVPVNDGGIALGQLVVAAARRRSLCA